MATDITQENFDAEVAQSKLPVIIDVHATWCGPCLQMNATFDELEKEFGSQYKFVKLNIDDARDVSIQYGVTSVPTFVFVKDNEVKGKETGYMSKETLLEKIQEALG